MTNYLENQDTLESSLSLLPVQEAFMRFGAAVLSMSMRVARDTKLNTSEMVALQHLQLDGPLVLRELRERISLTSGAMTTLVDRLEHQGFVKRKPHPRDRRSVVLHYLPQEEGDEGDFQEILAAVKGVTDAMDESERSAVIKFLTSLTTTLMEATQTPRK